MSSRPPNIILILTDHFRRDALGRSTPNLMRLAAGGVRFENAYCASPLCQPARVSLVTGLYPSQTGVCGNQSDPIPPYLRDDTFMRHLRRAGYQTALVGKHHFIDRWGVGMDVLQDDDEVKRYGFDHVFQVLDDGENRHNDDHYTRYLKAKGLLETFRQSFGKGFRHPLAEDDTADGFIGRNGIRFIEEYAQERPFYLNLSFVGPHPPLWHPGELQHDPAAMPPAVGAPDDPATRQRRAHYMDKCALIDRYVGRLVEALKSRGLLDSTVIIFTSDHGDNLGDYGIWDKRFFYEQSAGVPLFLCGPGIPKEERMNGPRVSKWLISHLDLYPTILRLAGVEPDTVNALECSLQAAPSRASQPRQSRGTPAGKSAGLCAEATVSRHRAGRDLLAMLHDAPHAGHEAVFAELGTCAMIRTGNWKLVFDPEQGGVQYVFNMAVDSKEGHNLAGVAGYETVVLDLVQRMLSHRIRLTQFTHVKEEQRLQRVRVSH